MVKRATPSEATSDQPAEPSVVVTTMSSFVLL
jgi:hypothetical protein